MTWPGKVVPLPPSLTHQQTRKGDRVPIGSGEPNLSWGMTRSALGPSLPALGDGRQFGGDCIHPGLVLPKAVVFLHEQEVGLP